MTEDDKPADPATETVAVRKSTIHLGRVDGLVRTLPREAADGPEVPPPPHPEQVRVMFSYLTPRGVSIYSKVPFEKNASIILSLMEPSAIDVKAIVSACSDKSNSGSVVSSQKFPYKVMLKFEMDKPEDMEKLKAYIQSLNKIFNDT
jgi:hypothetical protein